jgi:serine/threonine-protein kinase
MILANGSGAGDYELLAPMDADDVIRTAKRLLEVRGSADALALLRAAPFELFEGSNHFGDEFSILHATLPVEAYERLRRREMTFRAAAKELQSVLEELNVYARFVVVDVEHDRAAWSPEGYDCERTAFASGGYADVFRARRLTDGMVFALKRLRGDDEEARARLRREIQEQRRIAHANVMTIVDHAPDFTWFTMPLAQGTLSELRAQVAPNEIRDLLDEVADGLAAAHELGLVHRDITPRNILRLSEAGASRWVISDWGLVRRPRGQTSTIRTHPGQPFGTEGFIAPEVANDGHEADARADVYSLGRVLGFVISGQVPRPNLSQDVAGPWRYVIQRMTHADPLRRVQSMAEVQALLTQESTRSTGASQKSPEDIASALSDEVARGSPDAVDALLELALANRDDVDLWLDHVAEISRDAVACAVERRPAEVGSLLESLLHHVSKNWGRREFDAMNTPLQRLQWIAEEAASRANSGLLEDAARALFAAEVMCERYAQRDRSRVWLRSLDGETAETVARALATVEGVGRWYLAQGWRATGIHPALRAALR